MRLRHPFDAHMATAPLWVKVVSRAGVAITFIAVIVLVLASLGVGPTYPMFATASRS
ncbi:hypothetical protein [Lentzea sp. NPDC051838]|uniref:hypothetical protein n=1 Tax=Lentzea sp. NPDC051838 TaxID=3154849 RepID=UPI0034440B5A